MDINTYKFICIYISIIISLHLTYNDVQTFNMSDFVDIMAPIWHIHWFE